MRPTKRAAIEIAEPTQPSTNQPVMGSKGQIEWIANTRIVRCWMLFGIGVR
ncbi:MAG: hypothetical protein ACRDHW_23450 [Ktedonobacteraceae bacterium]